MTTGFLLDLMAVIRELRFSDCGWSDPCVLLNAGKAAKERHQGIC